MKTTASILLASLCLSGCQSFTKNEQHLGQNGYIRSGSMVSVTHSNPGVYPSETIAYANNALSSKIYEITHEGSAECFIVPTIFGYDIVILTLKALTKEQNEEIYRSVTEAIDRAWDETAIYRKENGA